MPLRSTLFVDGCFWHGCPIHSKPARWLKKSSMKDASTSCSSRLRGKSPSPRTGRAFWTHKLRANIARDRLVNRTLRHAGWTVLRIWEHDLAKAAREFTPIPYRGCLRRIRRALIPSTGRYQ